MIKKILFLVLIFCVNQSYAQVHFFKLYFDIDVYALNERHKQKLIKEIETLDRQKVYEIELEGSADYLGFDEDNQLLSENRAESVIEFITANYAGRFAKITYKGLGEQAIDRIVDEQKRGIQEHRSTNIIFVEKPIAPPIVATPKPEPPPKPTPAPPQEPDPEPVIEEVEETEIIASQDQSMVDEMKRLKVGDKLVLENLQFQPGRHFLRDISIPTLKLLLKILEDNPNLEIEIHGHVCCGKAIGGRDGMDLDTQKYNLSKTRAKHIYLYLIENGIDKKRLSHKGFAFDQPLYYPERHSGEQKANRRVEIKIVKN